MSTTHDLGIEPHMVPAICARFRHGYLADIETLSGERTEMVIYLATTHDLTPSEAAEALEDCLTFRTAALGKAA